MSSDAGMPYGLATRHDPQDAPPLWRVPPPLRPLADPPRPVPPLFPATAARSSCEPLTARRSRGYLVRLGSAAALAVTAVTAAAVAACSPVHVPAAPPAGTDPLTSTTVPVPPPDFVAIPDPCALPVQATLQRLSPGATWWPTQRTPRWSCTWVSAVDHQGSRMHRKVELRITIATDTSSDDARAVARAIYEDQRARDHATWGARYQAVPHLGEGAYSGYAERAATGESKTGVLLRNLVFDVTYRGDTWNPPGPDAPPQEALAESAARMGSLQLAREVAYALTRCMPCFSGTATFSGSAAPAGGVLPVNDLRRGTSHRSSGDG
ncbi:hypothetical protein [Actinomadura sp. SCN-SB]|uniref:hypothetical protein n=1 Tax=Actinomadura sp. SCN-SB TaxID=3373092 RepID=UPI003752C134